MLKNHKVGWPAIVLASVVVATLGMVLTFADSETKSVVVEWIGWGGFALSQFVGPMLRKRGAAAAPSRPSARRRWVRPPAQEGTGDE